jgi:peptidylprolyl isomerase
MTGAPLALGGSADGGPARRNARRRLGSRCLGAGVSLDAALGVVLGVALGVALTAGVASAASSAPRSGAEIVRDAPASAWRTPDPANLLLMTLATGTVVIELAPRFAPRMVANVRTLVGQHYFDGLAILRVQDDYVVQWGDPEAEAETPPAAASAPAASAARSLGAAAARLPPEFSTSDRGLAITRLKDRDVWAPVTGFVDGFAVGDDPKAHRAWLAHCYGVVGAGRDDAADSGNGAELYAVIGQSPRGLDQNITTIGHVLQGMELLAALPRGGPHMGFYEHRAQDVPIQSVRLLSELPPKDRPAIHVLRTDTPEWAAYVESRRNRPESWFVHRSNAVDMCNLTVPVRLEPPPTGKN